MSAKRERLTSAQGSAPPLQESCHLRILPRQSCVSPPIVLLSVEAPSALSRTERRVLEHILINPCENAQRLFVCEKIKTDSVAWVFATRLDPCYVSGLAGLYFAMSDAGAASVLVQGPAGTGALVDGIKRFVRRKHPALKARDVQPQRPGCLRHVSLARARVLCVSLTPGARGSRPFCFWCLGEEHDASSSDTASSDDSCLAHDPPALQPALVSDTAMCYVVRLADQLTVAVIDCRAGQEAILNQNPHLAFSCPAHKPNVVVHLCDEATFGTGPYQAWMASLHLAPEQHVLTHAPLARFAASDAHLAALARRLPRLFPWTLNSAAEAGCCLHFDLALDKACPVQPRVAALTLATQIDVNELPIDQPTGTPTQACLVVLGSGAAKPSSLRGLSCVQLWFHGAATSALLDCGEGTLFQMARAYGADALQSAVDSIEFVWISHAHLDHHGGLASLLARRGSSRLVVLGPASVGAWLAASCPAQAYAFYPCGKASCAFPARLTSMAADHCYDSHSLAVDLSVPGIPGEVRVVYSGDTRPNPRMLAWSSPNLILVHEATFGNDMREEADAKRHSVVADTVDIATKMKARALILTHVSQRYPVSLPAKDLTDGQARAGNCAVVMAADLVCVNIAQLLKGELQEDARALLVAM
jgi:ribonuclease BN (tRNA processing enzyme)